MSFEDGFSYSMAAYNDDTGQTMQSDDIRQQCEKLLWDIALCDEEDDKSVDRLVALITTTNAKARAEGFDAGLKAGGTTYDDAE